METAAKKEREDWLKYKGWTRTTKYKYGLNREDYVAMLERQDYKCAISGCGFVHRYKEWHELNPAFGEMKGEKHHHHYLLYVDHCHETGKVRGLLCSQCNLHVGAVEHITRGRVEIQSFSDYVLNS